MVLKLLLLNLIRNLMSLVIRLRHTLNTLKRGMILGVLGDIAGCHGTEFGGSWWYIGLPWKRRRVLGSLLI
ncbi:hypothetical protein HanXRQr2_Chr09g0412641 [Helianthus annuus]|uniref:Secreted protein n=1 Tax=Helianthus annuus TaxID=4232 RepID=A0A9K3IA70_HELAN|nr:hypothetical protein HanXRQr2_Chr09g0412641 [Helianthus annuus]KAJ0544337.1 hypothetical protein HanHA89_Chr09g0360461 [Helianthus annuus]